MEENYLYNDENKNERPPFKNCQVCRFKIPVDESINIHIQMIKQLIGKSGSYFKYLTKQCKLRFIWYNKDTKEIDIWGKETNIPLCSKKIELKIYNILNKMYDDGSELKPETHQWLDDYHRNFKKF